jgi:phosphoribosylformylglycinamidine synthase
MPEYRAIVNVMLRRAILDPQGRAVEATLHRLGHGNVGDLRVGKRIELTLSGERAEVEAQLARIVERVLSNPVMEDATYELHEVDAPAAAASGATDASA